MDNNLKWIFGNNALNKAYFNSTQIYPINEKVTVNVTGVSEGFEITLLNVITCRDNNEYIPLEYIESTGSQYIDTGFIPNQDTKVIARLTAPIGATNMLFGARESATSKFYGFVTSSSKWHASGYNSHIVLDESFNIDGVIEINKDKNITKINGILAAEAEYEEFVSPCSMMICALNQNGSIVGYGKTKIYSFQIYDNGTLVKDYVPVKNAERIAGLYDKVNDAFYPSYGTKDFVAGPEAIYIPVEYIESTGSQYIDTGFKPNQDTRVVMDVQCLIEGNNYFLFGARTNINNDDNTALTYGFNAYNTFYRSHYYNGWKDFPTSVKFTDRFVLNKNKNVTTIGGSNVITHSYTTFQCAYNMYLFAANTANTANTFGKSKLYSCQIYDNGTIVRDFIPVKRSDGVAGLYDKVDKTFYASESSTALIAGPESSTINITQTTTSATHKIPFGTKYMISASDIDGFVTPESLSYVANMKNRNVTLTYNPTNGVYIQDTDGYFHTTDAWDGTYTADCVAVITNNCRFGISLTEASDRMYIHSAYGAALENYTTAISDETQAKADYNGATNTTNIMKLQPSTDYAAGWCNAYVFPSGKKGFLPSLGQMWAAYSNKAAIDVALTKAGGTAFTSAYYWTSTFYGKATSVARSCWVLDWSDGDATHNDLTTNRWVRAFCSI